MKKITFVFPELNDATKPSYLNRLIKTSSSEFACYGEMLNFLFSLENLKGFPFAALLAKHLELPNAQNSAWAILQPVELQADLAGIY